MRVLLSTVGTRGDVQPLIALAEAVRARGHVVRLCVPPNFTAWAAAHGFEAVAVGIEMRAPRAGAAPPATPALVTDLITNQFDVLHEATRDCDVLLGAGAHQYAARSMAELRGIRYVNALYAPSALPSEANTRAWNERSRDRVNANRARFGLPAVEDVLSHIVTDEPWLAADATLAPLPARDDMRVRDAGAWLLVDDMPHDDALARFLEAGAPPVYVGFGGMPVPDGTARTVIDAVRRTGARVILASGWADLAAIDTGDDCLVVDEVNQQRLFTQVAAVVHHGGAGTTHTAALAGAPQVVVPLFGDQPYWAGRVQALGIGDTVPVAALSAGALATALEAVLDGGTRARAAAVAASMVTDGAERAAAWLT